MPSEGKKYVQQIKLSLGTVIADHVNHLNSKGSSLHDIAAGIGMAQSRLSCLRSRKLNLFSLDGLIAIAVDLGLTVRVSAKPHRKYRKPNRPARE